MLDLAEAAATLRQRARSRARRFTAGLFVVRARHVHRLGFNAGLATGAEGWARCEVHAVITEANHENQPHRYDLARDLSGVTLDGREHVAPNGLRFTHVGKTVPLVA